MRLLSTPVASLLFMSCSTIAAPAVVFDDFNSGGVETVRGYREFSLSAWQIDRYWFRRPNVPASVHRNGRIEGITDPVNSAIIGRFFDTKNSSVLNLEWESNVSNQFSTGFSLEHGGMQINGSIFTNGSMMPTVNASAYDSMQWTNARPESMAGPLESGTYRFSATVSSTDVRLHAVSLATARQHEIFSMPLPSSLATFLGNSAAPTLTYLFSAGSENDRFGINWIDNVAVRQDAITRPKLFLDFDSQIDRSFIVRTNWLGDKVVEARIGHHPQVAFLPERRLELVQETQKIFDRSGIPIEVTSIRPSEPVLRVRFGTRIGDYYNLLGRAYDVGPKGSVDVPDRFNRRPDGDIAVFVDGQQSALDIADTIAHEAGHGYGLMHIYNGNCREVMDYCDSASPLFQDQPIHIRINPTAEGESGTDTHNPKYHLLRYLVGQAPDSIGLTPGTYDVLEDITFRNVVFRLEEFATRVSDISIWMFDSWSNSGSGETSVWLASELGAGESLSFIVPTGMRFRIIASSGDSAFADVAFGRIVDGVLQTEFVAGDPLEMVGGVFIMSAAEGEARQIGEFAASFAVSQVNEPGTLTYFIGVGLALLLRRRRHKCRVQHQERLI